MLKTTNGGEDWNEVTTPFTGTFTDVTFFDENTGWLISNDGIGRTFDGGLTWEIFNPPHGQDWLYGAAYFTDPNNGWLVGATGHILKFEGGISSVTDDKKIISNNFELYQNYPNPFNPITKISWQSSVSGWHTLKIFNVLGKEVVTLMNEFKPAGKYEVKFDARALPSGIYFYRLQ